MRAGKPIDRFEINVSVLPMVRVVGLLPERICDRTREIRIDRCSIARGVFVSIAWPLTGGNASGGVVLDGPAPSAEKILESKFTLVLRT